MMPMGKGTYGDKVGSPKKKKDVTFVKAENVTIFFEKKDSES